MEPSIQTICGYGWDEHQRCRAPLLFLCQRFRPDDKSSWALPVSG